MPSGLNDEDDEFENKTMIKGQDIPALKRDNTYKWSQISSDQLSEAKDEN